VVEHHCGISKKTSRLVEDWGRDSLKNVFNLSIVLELFDDFSSTSSVRLDSIVLFKSAQFCLSRLRGLVWTVHTPGQLRLSCDRNWRRKLNLTKTMLTETSARYFRWDEGVHVPVRWRIVGGRCRTTQIRDAAARISMFPRFI
jgi:hypothetical protein